MNDEYQLLFTLPNSDTNGRIITAKVKEYVAKNPEKSFAITSLGKKRYYSALKYATAVVGNSSSGLIEAPIFNIPTLNIGNRQEGRTRCESIIDVPSTFEAIREGLKKATSPEYKKITSKVKSPYEKDGSVENVFKIIKNYPLDGITKKKFYDLN